MWEICHTVSNSYEVGVTPITLQTDNENILCVIISPLLFSMITTFHFLLYCFTREWEFSVPITANKRNYAFAWLLPFCNSLYSPSIWLSVRFAFCRCSSCYVLSILSLMCWKYCSLRFLFKRFNFILSLYCIVPSCISSYACSQSMLTSWLQPSYLIHIL